MGAPRPDVMLRSFHVTQCGMEAIERCVFYADALGLGRTQSEVIEVIATQTERRWQKMARARGLDVSDIIGRWRAHKESRIKSGRRRRFLSDRDAIPRTKRPDIHGLPDSPKESDDANPPPDGTY